MWWWSENNTGSNATSTVGHNDNFSVTITGNTSSATVILPDFGFKVEKGKKYAISGWMKGDNIPSGATASISTEYYHSPSRKPLTSRNYKFLVDKITNYTKYIEEKGFPVYFGEFGAGRPCFENDKGGDRWVADCMNIFDSLGYHFTYHSYKESSFGYYDGWEKPADTTTVNTKLRNVFLKFFDFTNQINDQIAPDAISFKVYPNPTGELLNIQTNNSYNFASATVTDANGKELFSTNNLAVNVQSLKQGLYFIRINNTDGKSSILKFVKK
jgi:endoglucanase